MVRGARRICATPAAPAAAALVALIWLSGGCRTEEVRSPAELKVTGLQTASGRPCTVVDAGFAPHVQQYTDRTYRYCRIPPELIGATYVRTANEDKASRGRSFLSFEVNRPVTVYVAHDNRIARKPGWLRRWRETGLMLESDDPRSQGYSLYSRAFRAGRVTLGGNGADSPMSCMFTVLVTPVGEEDLPPVVDVGMDRSVVGTDEPLCLEASIVDDRLSRDEFACMWSCRRGPGPVVFSDARSAGTTATFGKTGRYELCLTASDGRSTAVDSLTVEVLPVPAPFDAARRNAGLVREGLNRCRAFLDAWLDARDGTTGLIPRELGGAPVWMIKDCAADCYPFMVLTAEITAPELLRGPCLEMLHAERRLTARVDSLPDDWDFAEGKFAFSDADLDRIQFGASEYIKDGLIAVTEWLGESPWHDRMLELVNDCWKHAEVETPFGPIVSTNIENNGEMLQVLPRLYWMTGEQKYLDWAVRLGDFYLLGTNHPTRDLDELRLRDHGCEVVSGLCELYATCRFALPEKYAAYKEPLYMMLDRILEVGMNADGLFYDIVNPQTGEVILARLGDNFGYNYNGYYTVYLVDGHEPYRQAVLRVMRALYRYPAFHGAEPMDGHCDAIEGALYLANREPVPRLDAWLDHAIRELWGFQQPDGTIIGRYLDGNFARTTLLYCLWKTQGVTLRPWREDLSVGASREGDTLELFLSAEADWEGRLRFDAPRHRLLLNLPLNWPRINQFSPQWTVVQADALYTLENAGTGQSTEHGGAELQQGIPLTLAAGAELTLRLGLSSSQ